VRELLLSFPSRVGDRELFTQRCATLRQGDYLPKVDESCLPEEKMAVMALKCPILIDLIEGLDLIIET